MRQAFTATVSLFTLIAASLRAADPPEPLESEKHVVAPIVEEPEAERDSPHEAVSILVYVTPGGEKPLRDGAVDYPIGTIILKQKLNGAWATELFTGMLKREPGYNLECGDWEFFTLSRDARRVTARGRIESCMDYHLDYEETGFVARDYLTSARTYLAGEVRQASGEATFEWRDEDLVHTAVRRLSKMVCVTEVPFDGLDPAVITGCVHPSEVRRQLAQRNGRLSDVPGGLIGRYGEIYGGILDFSNRFSNPQMIPRILSFDGLSRSIVAGEPPRVAGETNLLREERIFVTSNNRIDPPQEFQRPHLPPPGVSSEFFGTYGEIPKFSDWASHQPGDLRILPVDGIMKQH